MLFFIFTLSQVEEIRRVSGSGHSRIVSTNNFQQLKSQQLVYTGMEYVRDGIGMRGNASEGQKWGLGPQYLHSSG